MLLHDPPCREQRELANAVPFCALAQRIAVARHRSGPAQHRRPRTGNTCVAGRGGGRGVWGAAFGRRGRLEERRRRPGTASRAGGEPQWRRDAGRRDPGRRRRAHGDGRLAASAVLIGATSARLVAGQIGQRLIHGGPRRRGVENGGGGHRIGFPLGAGGGNPAIGLATTRAASFSGSSTGCEGSCNGRAQITHGHVLPVQRRRLRRNGHLSTGRLRRRSDGNSRQPGAGSVSPPPGFQGAVRASPSMGRTGTPRHVAESPPA